MFIGSSLQRNRSSSISSNTLNLHSQTTTRHIVKTHRGSQKSMNEESSDNPLITSKILLRSKVHNNDSTQVTGRRDTTIKEKTIEDPFEMFEPFNVDDKMRLAIPNLVDPNDNGSKSTGKKTAGPVFGFPLSKILGQTKDQFTQRSTSSKSEIPNLRSQAVLNNFSQDRALSAHKDNTRANRFLVKSITQERRLSSLNADTSKEIQERLMTQVNLERASYSPAPRDGPEDNLSKRPQTVNASMKYESNTIIRHDTAFNETKDMVGSNENKLPEGETEEQQVPKQGSLLKYFRNTIMQCKTAQKIRTLKRCNTEINFKTDRAVSPTPSIETRGLLSNMITPIKARNEGNAVRLRNQNSQTTTVSRTRPSTSRNCMVTDNSITKDRVLSVERQKAEEAPYVANFVVKVKDYLETKYEPTLVKANSTRVMSMTGKDSDLSKLQSPPGRTQKYGLDDFSSFNVLSSDKRSNTRLKTAPPGQVKKSLFTESSTNHGDYILKGITKTDEKQRTETPTQDGKRYSVTREGFPEFDENISFQHNRVDTYTFFNQEDHEFLNQLEGEEIKDVEDKPELQEEVKQIEKRHDIEDENTLEGLVKYANKKTKEIEEYLVGSTKGVLGDEESSRRLGIANLVAVRGGTTKNPIKLNRRKSKGFIGEKDEITGVYKEIAKLEGSIDEETKFTKDFYEARDKGLEKAAIIRPDFLTQKELEFVRMCYSRQEFDDSSLKKLDTMLSRLRFFSLLGQDVRRQFYKNAQYVKYKSGDCIFEEGDIGDQMYVIIRGSVNVRGKKVGENGEVHTITLVSLGDGSHFGDLAMIVSNAKRSDRQRQQENFKTQKINLKKIQYENRVYEKKSKEEVNGLNKSDSSNDVEEEEDEKTMSKYMAQHKRSATIICAEDCELFSLGKDKYKEVLAETMNKDMNVKVKLLNSIRFFKELDPIALVPFAANFRKETFKLGQRIIGEGQPVMKFYIILKGKCRVVKELIEDNRLGRDHCQPKQRLFKFKNFSKPKRDSESRTNQDSTQQLQDEFIEKIVDQVTSENDLDEKEKLKGKLKSINFRPLGNILETAKVSEKQSYPSERAFHKERLSLDRPGTSMNSSRPNHMSRNHILFKELDIGSIFGFRPLFRRESDTKYCQLIESKAKLSIIADSKEVELYAMTRDCLSYIPEGLRNLLIDSLEKMPDFDDEDIKGKLREHNDWRKFKINLTNEIINKPENGKQKKDFYKAT